MELTIEKWIYGGEGIARMAPDESGRGKAVFIPFVLPGEVVEAVITEVRPGFARAQLESIKKSSPDRLEPKCPYFLQCGGCQYQHANYDQQLKWKRDILLETLQRTAKIKLEPAEVHLHSGEPYGYRNRTRLKVATDAGFAIGYHKLGTNQLLPVKECPISSPLIQRAIAATWVVGAREINRRGLREIQYFADHDDGKLLVEFYTDRDIDGRSLEQFARALQQELPAIEGISIFASMPTEDDDLQPLPSNKSAGQRYTVGAGALEYKTESATFRVSAGSFFQTNRLLIDELVRTAIGNAKGRTALDLYAGTGLFSASLAQRFDRVIAVESSPFSFADLQHNAARNAKAVQALTDNYLDGMGSKPGLDLVLIDPPRSGMGERTARKLGQTRAPRITYVSCDPATLSRDLRVLTASGFQVQAAHLVEMFPQTYHMETVVHLVR